MYNIYNSDGEKYTAKYDIKILFIGNSLTLDSISYVPYLIKTFYPDISFKFCVFYNGGYTLDDYYTAFQNGTPCEIYAVANNSAAWTKYENTIDINSALTGEFDIVCLQEYFNYKTEYTIDDLTSWTNCRDYITSQYSNDNGLEYISLLHPPKRDVVESVYPLTLAGNALILHDTITVDMIPVGIAIYRAMQTSLDSLGDRQHLSVDGTHAQEGLPCLLQAYTILLWIFDKLSINKSVYGLNFKMTSAIYNTINVPGASTGTGIVVGTDEQNLLGQEVAVMAYKEGKKFVINNMA